MKMGKKKLKFKFLVVCLMFVLTFGIVSLNTFAFTFNPENFYDELFMGISVDNLDTNYGYDYSDNDYMFSFYVDDDLDDYYYVYIDTDNEEFTIFNDDRSVELTDVFGNVIYVNDINSDYEYFQVDELIQKPFVDDLFIDLIVYEPPLLESIFDVFTNIGTYIMFLVSSLIVVFYAEGQLTILGILALCGLAISIILLILNIIQNFLHFRG